MMQESIMAQESFKQFEVPPEMRAFAEKSVDQAKKAFDGFVAAANQAVSGFEGHAAAAQAGAKQVVQKAMTFAEQNVSHSFEFAQKLMRAQDAGEVVKLHSDYVAAQLKSLQQQAQELSQSGAQAAMDAAKPKQR
jgi:phasin